MKSSWSQAELNQYRRHLSLEGFGDQGQEKLCQSSVLVIGAGGLGCPVLQYLAAAGVGRIGIIDHDQVEISNLQRQVLFQHQDVGKNKAKVAAKRLHSLNPLISIISYPEKFSEKNANEFLQDYDLVVDGTDNFASRYLINDACLNHDLPLVHGSIHQYEGMVTVFNLDGGPTYRCLFPQQPDSSSIPSCAEAGVIGVLPGIIGSIQALEAIKVLTKIGKPLSGKLLLYDALKQIFRTLELKPTIQGRQKRELQSTLSSCNLSLRDELFEEISEEELFETLAGKEKIQVLDVREDWERYEQRIEPSLHQPLTELTASSKISTPQGLDPEQKIVVYCKAGVRSRIACKALHEAGFRKLYNLSGGIDRWSTLFPEFTQSG